MKSVLILTMLFSLRSWADNIEMIKIQTDADTNAVAVMSIETLADKTIQNISYNIEGAEEKSYSVEKLKDSRASLFKNGPVSILDISTESISKTDIILTVRYLYNFSFFGSDRRVKKLQMRYVAPDNTFETIDIDTQKVVRNAFAYVRYVKGVAKGIERIETW